MSPHTTHKKADTPIRFFYTPTPYPKYFTYICIFMYIIIYSMGIINTLIILGSGFDVDLGLKISFSEFSKSHLNPVCNCETWGDFENELREQVINWYNNGRDENLAQSLNTLWCCYRKNISFFFTERSDKFEIDSNKCAYKFLQSISEKSKIYSFNYTNPFEYVDITKPNEIIHLHGIHYRDTFKKTMGVMSQGSNIVLGIDYDCIPQIGMENKYISSIAKIHQEKYCETNLTLDLLHSINIIFFGFSMCDVDFHYFRDLFCSIENGSSCCKNIFYITYKEEDFKNFCDNLERNGFNYDTLKKNLTFLPIYTANGSQDKNFRDMLKFL